MLAPAALKANLQVNLQDNRLVHEESLPRGSARKGRTVRKLENDKVEINGLKHKDVRTKGWQVGQTTPLR